MNKIKSTIIAIFMISMANSILVRDTMAQAIRTSYTTEKATDKNGDHCNPKPSQATASQSMTEKISPSHAIKKPKPQLTSKKQSTIRRCYNSFLKHVWGIGSFKEHCLRRIGVVLASTISGIAITKNVFAEPMDNTEADKYDGCEPIENQFVYAAYKGDKAKVEELLDKCVDVNTVATSKCSSLNKQTALHVASDQGHLDIIHILLQAKANINARNGCGKTPLFHASGNPATVAVLLGENADVAIANDYGCLPLHAAAGLLQDESVQLLLAKNLATINHQHNWGGTALHSAVFLFPGEEDNKEKQEKRYNTVKLLLQYNANPNLKSIGGKTPYDMAEHDKTKYLLRPHMTEKQ